METFDFDLHSPTHIYPKGDSFKFGRGYQFSAAPQMPIQRTFVLHFEAIVWFFNEDGTLDLTTSPNINAGRLDAFYQRNMTWKTFIYPHPVFGNLKVKFDPESPFEVPKSIKGGNGVTEDFELRLIEQAL